MTQNNGYAKLDHLLAGQMQQKKLAQILLRCLDI